MNIAKNYSHQGIKKISSASLSQGVQDILAKRALLMTEIDGEVAILKVTQP